MVRLRDVECRMSMMSAILLISVLAIIISGCGGGGSSSQGGIFISNTYAEVPSDLSTPQIPVVVKADVTAESDIDHVQAQITGVDDSQKDLVDMTLLSGHTYTGTYMAPANTQADGSPEVYAVIVSAVNSKGNSVSANKFTFDVPVAEPPFPF